MNSKQLLSALLIGAALLVSYSTQGDERSAPRSPSSAPPGPGTLTNRPRPAVDDTVCCRECGSTCAGCYTYPGNQTCPGTSIKAKCYIDSDKAVCKPAD